MKVAKKELGQREIAGSKANPRILQYFKSARFWGQDDSGSQNAWCASYTAWVMEQEGHTPPKNAYRAKAWELFGKKVKVPTYGVIAIKSRKGGGHVAFVIGQSPDGKQLYMLGGNQKDTVQISTYDKNVWETFVVPRNYDPDHDWLPIYRGLSEAAGKES